MHENGGARRRIRERVMILNMKQQFEDELCKMRLSAATNQFFLTETNYKKLINEVQKAKMTPKKEPRDYWLLNHYDVMIVANKSKLNYSVKEGISSIQYQVTDSELFLVLYMKFICLLDTKDVIEC